MRHSFISTKSRFVSLSVLSLLMATAAVQAESLLIRNVSIISDGISGDNPQPSAAQEQY